MLRASGLGEDAALGKNNLKSKAPKEEELSKETRTNTRSSRGHTETQRQQRKKRPIRDTARARITEISSKKRRIDETRTLRLHGPHSAGIHVM